MVKTTRKQICPFSFLFVFISLSNLFFKYGQYEIFVYTMKILIQSPKRYVLVHFSVIFVLFSCPKRKGQDKLQEAELRR